ncbi:hypothetical protein CYMTET_48861 [Cymbomonas tetramitiformis]|uniref:Uncharacterized protein n=1 Tax=Cymbomonas tetramitiformis TaxID=36881 RepID=A0AAE0EUQ4_9CHLO|nr:hypothetical protein CYMTET_48861 [Cymbomonas tetramitiformis]
MLRSGGPDAAQLLRSGGPDVAQWRPGCVRHCGSCGVLAETADGDPPGGEVLLLEPRARGPEEAALLLGTTDGRVEKGEGRSSSLGGMEGKEAEPVSLGGWLAGFRDVWLGGLQANRPWPSTSSHLDPFGDQPVEGQPRVEASRDCQLRSAAGAAVQIVKSREGAQQGDPMGPLFLAAPLQVVLEWVQKKHPGVIVFAYLDDACLLDPPLAAADVDSTCVEDAVAPSLHIKPGESAAYSPEGDTNCVPEAVPRVPGKPGFIDVLWVPAGENAAVAEEMRRTRRTHCGAYFMRNSPSLAVVACALIVGESFDLTGTHWLACGGEDIKVLNAECAGQRLLLLDVAAARPMVRLPPQRSSMMAPDAAASDVAAARPMARLPPQRSSMMAPDAAASDVAAAQPMVRLPPQRSSMMAPDAAASDVDESKVAVYGCMWPHQLMPMGVSYGGLGPAALAFLQRGQWRLRGRRYVEEDVEEQEEVVEDDGVQRQVMLL